jgi:predicted DNA-binding transcriptional regulator YafY
MDILKHGAEVEVIKPEELRKLLSEQLQAAMMRYRTP